jgi:hypothetical protein
MEATVGIRRYIRIMCHQNNSDAAFPVQVLKNGHDLHSGSRIQCSSGFVCEENARIVNQRARDRDALLLSTGELARLMLSAFAESNGGKSPSRSLVALLCRNVGVHQRQFDVFCSARSREQIELLKHKSDFSVSDLRKLIAV